MCISHYRLSCPCIMFAQPNTSSRTFLSFLPSSFPLHDASAAPLQPSPPPPTHTHTPIPAPADWLTPHASPASHRQILLGMTVSRSGNGQDIPRGDALSGRAERRWAAGRAEPVRPRHPAHCAMLPARQRLERGCNIASRRAPGMTCFDEGSTQISEGLLSW